jgi:Fic family protein
MEKLLKEIDLLQAEINQHRPLSPRVIKQIKEYFRVGFTYSSNALEGNTLTESETKVVLEDGITIGGKPLRDHLEAIGNAKAYDYIFTIAKKKDITENDIKQLHKLFYQKIDNLHAGFYRKKVSYISGSEYPIPLPEQMPDLMLRLPATIKALRKKYHPVVFSALAHKEFVFVHPFIDGNGRVSRLLMNLILLQEDYTIAIIPPDLRKDYIATLEKAHENDKPFQEFIALRVRETQEKYLRIFRQNF